MTDVWDLLHLLLLLLLVVVHAERVTLSQEMLQGRCIKSNAAQKRVFLSYDHNVRFRCSGTRRQSIPGPCNNHWKRSITNSDSPCWIGWGAGEGRVRRFAQTGRNPAYGRDYIVLSTQQSVSERRGSDDNDDDDDCVLLSAITMLNLPSLIDD